MIRIKNIRAGEMDLARKQVYLVTTPGVPTAADGVGICGKGSLCVDALNAKLYINTGTRAVPAWTVVGTQT